MNFLKFLIVVASSQVSLSLDHVYEESISDLLVDCNAYQSQLKFNNRTVHSCEKKDPEGDFSYHITPLTAKYSERIFLCVLFFKNDYTNLDFKLLFSHAQFNIDAVRKHFIRDVMQVITNTNSVHSMA